MSTLDSLCIYLPLDSIVIEEQGSDYVVDKTGNSNDASVVGDVSIITDDTFGHVCNFPGNEDYLIFPVWSSNNFNGAFDPGERTYTITAWVCPNDLAEGDNTIFSIASPASSGGQIAVELGVDSERNLYARVDAFEANVRLETNETITANTWHFIAMVVNGNSLTLRHNSIDTAFTSSNNIGFNLPADGAISVGGCLANATFFNGLIANVRVYRDPLTSAEIDDIVDDDLANELQLLLPLDNITNNTVEDVSGNNFDGRIEGTLSNISLITDPTFGSVVHFLGEYPVDISLFNPTYTGLGCITSITVQMWVRTTGNGAMQLIDYNGASFYGLYIDTYNSQSGIVHWQTCDRTNVNDILYSTQNINDGQWHFISVLYEAGTGAKQIYIDGILNANKTAHLAQPLGYSGSCNKGTIGSTINGSRLYAGDLSQVYIYHRAISPIGIEQDMASGVVTTSSFNNIFPLGFQLVDDGEVNTLYITDVADDSQVQLQIANMAKQAIVFAEQNSVSASDYQMQLLFRPGIISSSAIDELSIIEADQWYFMVGDAFADGSVPLYFNAKQELTFYPLDSISITLLNLTVDPAGGTRSTRVQMAYQGLIFQGGITPVTGQREITINILNHQGKKEIPLIAGFSGTNQILIDQNNTVSFRITNGLSSDTSYNGAEANNITLNADEGSCLVLSFEGWDANSNEPIDSNWDVNTYQELSQITEGMVTLNTSLSDVTTEWAVEQFKEGEQPFWRLKPTETVVLGPRDSIVFEIQNLVPVSPSGQSNMYIQYQNIPGYWDGQFTLILEKGVIKEKNSKVFVGNENSGFGYASNALKFYVNDNAYPRLNLANDGGVTIGSAAYAGYINILGGDINLEPHNSSNFPSLHWTSSAGNSAIQYYAPNGNALGGLRLKSYPVTGDVSNSITALSILDSGKVVIGETANEPQSPLTVEGGEVALRRHSSDDTTSVKFTDEGNNVKSALASKNENNVEQLGLYMDNFDPSKPKLILNDSDTQLKLQANNASALIDATNNGQIIDVSAKLTLQGNNHYLKESFAELDFFNNNAQAIMASIQGRNSSDNAFGGALVLRTRSGDEVLEDRLSIDYDYGNVGIGTTPNSSDKLKVQGAVNVQGDVKYSGVLKPSTKPFILKRYSGFDGEDDRDTGMSASTTMAIVAGFSAEGGDIEEHDAQTVDIRVLMKIKNGRWYIDAQLATHNENETWTVDVLFIDYNLVSDLRNIPLT